MEIKGDLLESYVVSLFKSDLCLDDGVYCLFCKLYFDLGEVVCILYLFYFFFCFGIKFGVKFGRVFMICLLVKVLLSMIMNIKFFNERIGEIYMKILF